MEIPHLRIWCAKNKVDRVRQLTHIFCILNFQDVTGRELDLLCEIIYNGGVNDKAKKSFMVNHKTSSENYGQVIKRLADKGILTGKTYEKGGVTKTGKILHGDFESLMTNFVQQDTIKMLAVLIP